MTEETRCDHCERQVVTRRYRPDERTSDRDNFRCETITHTHTRIHARGSVYGSRDVVYRKCHGRKPRAEHGCSEGRW